MLVAAIGAGLLIGLSLGGLGGGGSILTVPALVYLLGQSAHQATATSLLVVGTAALAGVASHARAGRVRLREGVIFGALGIAGAYAGSQASTAVPADLLLAGFGALMLAVAVLMIARRRAAPPRSPGPDAATVSSPAVPEAATGTPHRATALGTMHADGTGGHGAAAAGRPASGAGRRRGNRSRADHRVLRRRRRLRDRPRPGPGPRLRHARGGRHIPGGDRDRQRRRQWRPGPPTAAWR